MDWFEWHKGYRSSSARKARLAKVRKQISNCLNACPTGEIRVVSVCAGDGRDLLGALMDHPRAPDVKARLVELDERVVECGRAAADAADLGGQLEFVRGDATLSSVYEGIVPAHLILVCGVFGHVSETQTHRLVRNLPFLCQTGGFVIWTRRLDESEGARHTAAIQTLLNETALEEVCFELTPEGRYGVATYRHLGEALALPNDQQLFEFAAFSGPRNSEIPSQAGSSGS